MFVGRGSKAGFADVAEEITLLGLVKLTPHNPYVLKTVAVFC